VTSRIRSGVRITFSFMRAPSVFAKRSGGLSLFQSLAGKPLGLRGKMTGHAGVKPAVNLGGKM
jgi:hypothetical protein